MQHPRIPESPDPQDDRPAPLAPGVLDRYLLGALNPDEAEQVRIFFDTPARRQQLAELQGWIEGTGEPRPDRRISAAELKAHILSNDRSTGNNRARSHGSVGLLAVSPRQEEPSVRQIWRRRVQRAVLGAGALLVFVALVRDRSNDRPSAHMYTTAIAQRAVVTLSDGSRVTLAPQTTLFVSAGFGQTNRDITLNGEAYFEVQHSAQRPVVVWTGGVRTQVLGTTFDIRRYSGERDTRVVVTDGRVKIVAPHATSSVIASAGMVGTVSDSTGTVAIMGDDTPSSDWRSGQLVFHKTSVGDVLGTLEHWYGYRFRMTDSALANRHITAVLDNNSPANALNTLKLVLHVDMTFDGNVVTLRPQRPAAAAPVRHRAINDAGSNSQEVGR